MAACAVVLLIFATSIYLHLNKWNIRSMDNESNLPMPNATGDSNPLLDETYAESKSGAVYHDIDASQLAKMDAIDQINGIVDKERSLERYKQTDQQLIDIMKSIVP